MILYEVAQQPDPTPTPWIVLRIDTDRPRGGGVQATIVSLHETREAAEAAAATARAGRTRH